MLPWLLPMLLVSATAAPTTMVPATNCQQTCGGVSIPYPFGIGNGCFRDGFEIYCNDTGNGKYKPYLFNVEVMDISVVQAQMRVHTYIRYACYDKYGNPTPRRLETSFNLIGTPYRFSDTRNKFTAIGCRTLAYIKDPYAPEQLYETGCLSICNKISNNTNGAPCVGMGCCQTSIPKGLDYYGVTFDDHVNHSYVTDFSPCSYAFLVDHDWYKFNSSDLYFDTIYNRNNRSVPVVLDWAIRKETCMQAKQNATAYACRSQNSICVDSADSSSYTCNCSSGFEGNPYIPGGCQDIDECKDWKQYPCHGKCTNLPGNYSCSCPSGTNGDPTKQEGCQPKFTLLLKMFIGCLCSFLVTAVMYLVYEKAKLSRAKQKCFRQNGGLLLQEQINAHQCVRFKMFSVEEMERATNNFDQHQVKGRGGQGTVYEGILDDKRRVAVKKAIMVDEKKKKDFAREMYILSLINHKNVIKILGCCLEVEVPMLVYEFISHGTLSQHIQNKNRSMPLGFRLRIAVDSASALAYLHSDASPPIVHGDVKTSNILLDDEYAAKISDFGASQLPFKDMNESGLPGTYGYLDPESLQTGELTAKSDVYSFAVVILELLTRKTAIYSEGPREKRSLAQTFKEKGLPDIIDDEIKNEVTQEQVDEFAELLTECLKVKGEERPTMTKVVAWLRRMQELNQNLSERSMENVEPLHSESSNQTTYIAEYYSSGHQAVFEIDYHLTR